jgi:hypothetical protein
MITLQQGPFQARERRMRRVPNAKHSLDERILRALNKIKSSRSCCHRSYTDSKSHFLPSVSRRIGKEARLPTQ